MTRSPADAAGRSNSKPERTAANRVVMSHAQTRATLRLALVFFGAAAIAGALGWRNDLDVWFALHLLLAGGVVLAISGVSLMLTVTWSAAPAPPDGWTAAQRWCVAVGAGGIGVARRAELPVGFVGAAAAVYLAGLCLLAWLLVTTIRQGSKRRYDVAVAAYLAALCAGATGGSLGATMALTTPSVPIRAAHVTVNLLGLVGFTIGGTLPFFASTVARSRMATRTTPLRLSLTLGWQVCAVAVAATAIGTEHPTVAAAGWFAYAAGVVAALVWMPTLTRRQLTWAGPRLLAMWVGACWWIVAVVATGVDILGDRMVLGGRWLFVLVIAGFAQVVWGSLAYLFPMLRGGGPERLSEGFASTRSWLGFAAVNVAGVAFAASWAPVAAVAVAVWVLDGAVRVARVGTSRHDRPAESANRPTEE